VIREKLNEIEYRQIMSNILIINVYKAENQNKGIKLILRTLVKKMLYEKIKDKNVHTVAIYWCQGLLSQMPTFSSKMT
jgi:hypothetical protein